MLVVDELLEFPRGTEKLWAPETIKLMSPYMPDMVAYMDCCPLLVQVRETLTDEILFIGGVASDTVTSDNHEVWVIPTVYARRNMFKTIKAMRMMWQRYKRYFPHAYARVVDHSEQAQKLAKLCGLVPVMSGRSQMNEPCQIYKEAC